MTEIKGIIFDFDGVILDTEFPEYQSWCQIYEEYNAVLPVEEWAKCLGTSANQFDVLGFLEKQVGKPVDRESLRARYWAMALEKITQAGPMPGILKTLEQAQQLGLKIGLASSSNSEWVVGHLERLNLRHFFEVIFTSERVQKVKPHPELYQAALNGLNIQANQAIAFEDSPNGITAARSAGIFTVAIPNQVSMNLPIQHADWIIPSLEQVPLNHILQHLQASRN